MASADNDGHKKKRAKIRLQFPEKLFYEKVLSDWKASCSERNQSHVIRKALDGLRLFPINVNGYSELRKIKGIGEYIATKLDAAWKNVCQNHFETEEPSIAQVKTLKKGEALPFLEGAFVSKGKHGSVPFLPRAKKASKASDKSNPVESWEKENDDISSTQKSPSKFASTNSDGLRNGMIVSSSSYSSTLFAGASTSSVVDIVSSSPDELLSYDPVDFEKCLLVLIVDGREQKTGKARFKTMSQHLEKLNVMHETRALSVGDYLWVLKFDDGGQKEMVLDYVVERKTWDDLKSSIRQTRYLEQKRRLKESGIRNVILVAEGQQTLDRGLEQALVTTTVDSRFLVHRTMNSQGTAKFLQTVTNRLTQRLKKERMFGPSFTSLQDGSRKTKTLTVNDCWLRQLTVCPMMSAERAKQISTLFLTMRSMMEFYRRSHASQESVDVSLLLNKEYPEVISKALSAQLSLFFVHGLL